jgi:hypothetical protein
MKSKKEVLQDNAQYKTLINAVYSRIGKDSIMDVVNHGIDNGFNGFIYYSETHTFAMRYRSIIVRMLEDTAESLGEDVVTMVSNFGVFRPRTNSRYTESGRMGIESTMDAEDKKDLYKYLGGGRPQQGTITNVMAWFAAEEVCRMFDN